MVRFTVDVPWKYRVPDRGRGSSVVPCPRTHNPYSPHNDSHKEEEEIHGEGKRR